MQMKITAKEVAHVADLARLSLDDAAIEKFVGQISEILEYVERLQQVDTTGVAGTAHALNLKNAFRDDVVHEHLGPDRSLANAPEQEDGSFVVPRIIE